MSCQIMSDKPTKQDMLKIALGAVGGILTTLLVTTSDFYGHVVSRDVGNRAVDAELMRVAVQVLELPIERTGEQYRDWACNVLQLYSPPTLDCSDASIRNRVLSGIGRFDNFARKGSVPGTENGPTIEVYYCPEQDQESTPHKGFLTAIQDQGGGTANYQIWGDRQTDLIREVELTSSDFIIVLASNSDAIEIITTAHERTNGLPELFLAEPQNARDIARTAIILCSPQ
jgi:hypothetical protein